MNHLEKMREVSAFVMENTKFFELEEIWGDIIHLKSRENDYKEYREEDHSEAKRIKKLIEEEFEGIEVEIGTCNEWVYIHIIVGM